MLTVSTFRSLLGAGLGLEANVAGYIDALQARRLLPADGVSLNARAVAIALLAIVSGLPPVEGAREALRMAEFSLAALTQRIDQPNGAAMAWHESRELGTVLGNIYPAALPIFINQFSD
jgi:hypothetical protein